MDFINIPNHVPKSTVISLNSGEIQWTSDFSATRDDKGDWNGSESFFCNILDVTRFLPKNGSVCQFPGFQFLKVNGCTVDNYEGDIVQVNVKYFGSDNWGFDYGDNDDDPGNGEYKTELSISTGEEPLPSHYKFMDKEATGALTDRERLIIRNFLSGKFTPETTTDGDLEVAVPYSFIDENNHIKAGTFKVESENGKLLLDKLTSGLESYLKPQQSWRVSYTSDKKPPSKWLNQVGFISTPLANPPAVSNGRNWLFKGITMSENKKDVYDVTLEWILSGPGGWDQDIYKKD